MNDTAKTATDTLETSAEGTPTSPPTLPIDRPLPVGDPEIVANPIIAVQRYPIAPAPLKI
ncbi:hypothetical protein [Hyphomicrobium sp. LHD-15]|uniref:hypothetical protein n=1 Tax=Hyphomicrobium sp. LHD-15 TaxID=3072142 RepID=UPI00280F7826|nr:hypothetical protein [Hyphomicrobium sp. LHD-15]MDQ8698145.1 hypothetical protein [Hyphomicrobium sp. LHD-15]